MGCSQSSKQKIKAEITQQLKSKHLDSQYDGVENLKTCTSAENNHISQVDNNNNPPLPCHNTLQQQILDSFESNLSHTCIQTCRNSRIGGRSSSTSPSSSNTRSFQHILSNAQRIGSAFINLNLAPVKIQDAYEFQFFAVLAEKREELIELELAGCLYGLTMLPLDLEYMETTIQKTEISTVFCSSAGLNLLISAIKKLKHGSQSILNLICFDSPSNDQIEAVHQLGINILEWRDIITRQSRHIQYPILDSEATLYSLDVDLMMRNKNATFFECGKTHEEVAQTIYQIMNQETLEVCQQEVQQQGHIKIDGLFSTKDRVLTLSFLSKGLTIGLPMTY